MRRSSSVLLALVFLACSSSSSPSPMPPGPSVPLQPGSPWPKFRGNAAQTALGTVHASQTGGASWSFTTGAGIFSSPIVGADGTVYFGSADQSFYALNPADGSKKWVVSTGEIIDSAGLLDDQGHLYFGSGDGYLRAVDASTGSLLWKFQAELPTATGGFINWFEGNVAIAQDGTLYVPNDDFYVYALDRTAGAVTWKYKMPDQTWSLPGIDVSTGTLFVGNNNLLPILGKNTYALTPQGDTNWSLATLGTVAASPLVTAGASGTEMIVGGFDGYSRAFSEADGTVLWQLATRDHIYASPAQLPDGTIVQPSADGTVYAVSPDTGAIQWQFDAGTPIRSSPAVDADGHVYVGGGDGNLYVLNPDGSLRFKLLLITAPRNDLNASPALGQDAVYIGGESGQMFSVPYDLCLRPMSQNIPGCVTKAPTYADGASLSWVNAFGDTQPSAPASMPGNEPVTLIFALRQSGAQQLAVLDTTSVTATVTPSSPVSVDVSGDGKFVSITPTVAFPPGPLTVSVQANYLVDMARKGLALSGGHVGGSVSASFSTTVATPTTGMLAPAAAYELSRLSIPLPTVMPSYNQIGFDQLRYLLGTVENDAGTGVVWMVGGVTPSAGAEAVVDPTTQAIIPMAFTTSGDLVTMTASSGIEVTVTSFTLPFQTFRLAMGFLPGGAASGTGELEGSAVCSQIGFYGPFLEQLGLCNPQTDVIRVLGAANTTERTDLAVPPATGTATFAMSSSALTATVTGSMVKPSAQLVGILAVDASTGLPVSLQYGTGTTRTTNADGTLASVSVPTTGVTLPAQMRVYLMVDTTVGASAMLP